MSVNVTPDTIEWSDPPPKAPSGNKWATFVEVLKTRPGEWAKFPGDYSSGGVHNLTKTSSDRFPGTEWATRKSDRPGRSWVWGRWIGDQS